MDRVITSLDCISVFVCLSPKLSQYTPHSSPVRTIHGVCFVNVNSDSINVVLYTLSYYTESRYKGTLLEFDLFVYNHAGRIIGHLYCSRYHFLIDMVIFYIILAVFRLAIKYDPKGTFFNNRFLLSDLDTWLSSYWYTQYWVSGESNSVLYES